MDYSRAGLGLATFIAIALLKLAVSSNKQRRMHSIMPTKKENEEEEELL
jgi:hypothetical protein